MKNKITRLLLAALILFTVGEAAFSQPRQEVSQADRGSDLFIQYRCARCHTIGRGVFVGPDLKAVGDRYSKEEILRWIENPQLIYSETGRMPVNEGFPPMPPLQVPPEDAAAIAEYVITASPSADEQTGGAITGRVLSGKDSTPIPGVGVTVTPFMGDKPSGEKKTLISGEDGSYSLTGLPWNRSYAISINYKGAEYSTDKMVFKPGEQIIELDLPVFEPTLSDENIRINETHLIVQLLEGALTVADLSVLENTGDSIYIGGKEFPDGRKESVRYSLPKGAFNVSFIHGLDSESVETTEKGFSDTVSVLPGPKRAVFSYNVPIESGKALIEKEIMYPTESFLLLILDTGDSYEVDGLREEGSVVINNETFLKWTGSELDSGKVVSIEVDSSVGGYGNKLITWAALGLLALIVIAGVVYSAFTRPGRKTPEPPKETVDSTKTGLSERRTALIKEIAALDDLFESGDIADSEYLKSRASKKNELLELTKKLRGL